MPPILTRIGAVGLGKEVTPGTAVAPTVFIPFQDATIEDTKTTITDNSALGTRYGAFAVDTSGTGAAGNLNGYVYDRSFGHLASAVMGSVSTATHATAPGVKVDTFGVASTLASYTIAKKDTNESVRHAYGMLNTLEITADTENYVRYTSAWLARQSAAVANTVAYTQENRFRRQDVNVYVADSVAALDAAVASTFKNFTLTINNNLINDPTGLGSTSSNYYPGVVETSLSFGKTYIDTTFKDLVFGTAPKALRIAIARTDVSIGTGTPTNPSIVITFEPGFFSEWGRDAGLDDLKQETISYQPIFSTTASKQFGLVMTNTETAY